MPAYHIISISRTALENSPSPRRLPSPDPDVPSAIPCALFTIRPWKKLLLNEGSGLDIFRTFCPEEYDYTSLVRPLLNASDPSLGPFLRSLDELSYIAIHPHGPISEALQQCLPPVRSLYLQFAPSEGPETDEDHLRPSKATPESVNEAFVTGSTCLPEALRVGRSMMCSDLCLAAIGNKGSPAWRGLRKLECKGAEWESVWKFLSHFYLRLQERHMLTLNYMGDGIFMRP